MVACPEGKEYSLSDGSKEVNGRSGLALATMSLTTMESGINTRIDKTITAAVFLPSCPPKTAITIMNKGKIASLPY
jgi:hypothetical protein